MTRPATAKPCARRCREALQRDPRVFLMGEDVGRYGGTYAVSKGLLEEFGAERIRDTPLSELGFVGAGIGAALGGMRPIVEVMTVNFSLLALDQIVNNAALLRHMSGGQFGVPLVIRMATGAGRQLAAQHSHSLEGWYAHVPGIARAGAGDGGGRARHAAGRRWHDPDPVLIFEHAQLYNLEGELPTTRRSVDIATRRGAARRHATSALITYGGSLPKALRGGRAAGRAGHRRRGDRPARAAPAGRRHACWRRCARRRRAVVVDEGWRTGSLAAEVMARIIEQALLRPRRAAGARVQRGGADSLRQAPRRRRAAAGAEDRRGGAAVMGREHDRIQLPSLGADMDEGTLRRVAASQPGEAVKRGQVVAVVDTTKAAVDVEIWHDGVVHRAAGRGRARRCRWARCWPRCWRRARAPGACRGAAPRRPTDRRSGRRAGWQRPRAVPCGAADRGARRNARRVSAGGAPARGRARAWTWTALAGSGPEGAVTLADVERGPARARAARRPAPAAVRRRRQATRSTAMRKAIAAAMSRSKREIPHYYLAETVPMRRALDWLRQPNAGRPDHRAHAAGGAAAQGGGAGAARRTRSSTAFTSTARFQPSRGRACRRGDLAARRRAGGAGPARRRRQAAGRS